MGWLNRTINSSIGRKTVMALTGPFLALFVIGHLLGNSNIFRGRAAFEAYAARLHSLGVLITVFEFILLAVFLLHVGFGLFLFFDNLRAKPNRYSVTASAGGRSWGSRTMPYTGVTILLFLAYHLTTFRFAGDVPVGELVRSYLTRPPVGAFYILGLAALTLHLSHGLWSFWQSLGLNHRKYNACLENGGLAAAVFIGGLFMMIPLLALFWSGFLR